MFTALNSGMRVALETDEKVCLFGEDVAFGGVFRCTMDLRDEFGGERVFNTPLAEQVCVYVYIYIYICVFFLYFITQL